MSFVLCILKIELNDCHSIAAATEQIVRTRPECGVRNYTAVGMNTDRPGPIFCLCFGFKLILLVFCTGDRFVMTFDRTPSDSLILDIFVLGKTNTFLAIRTISKRAKRFSLFGVTVLYAFSKSNTDVVFPAIGK